MASEQGNDRKGPLKAYLSDISSFGLMDRQKEVEVFQLLYAEEDAYLRHLVSQTSVALPVLKDAQARMKGAKDSDEKGIAVLRSVLRYLGAGKEERAADKFVEGSRQYDSIRSLQILIYNQGREIGDKFGPPDEAHNQWFKQTNVLLGQVTAIKNQIAVCNLRLVVMWANRYYGTKGKLSISDMVQEGNFGLFQAIDKFDATREVRFATYASWWIRQSIRRGTANMSRTVRLPVHVLDKISKLSREESQYITRTGKGMTQEEAVKRVGVTLKNLNVLREAQGATFSLDALADPEFGDTFVNMIEDTEAKDPEMEMEKLELRKDLKRVMGRLTPVEDYIIRMRFGLDGNKFQTLRQIGDKYDLSRERIRQLETRALKKMRKHNGVLSQYLPVPPTDESP